MFSYFVHSDINIEWFYTFAKMLCTMERWKIAKKIVWFHNRMILYEITTFEFKWKQKKQNLQQIFHEN